VSSCKIHEECDGFWIVEIQCVPVVGERVARISEEMAAFAQGLQG
jgi:hypothetical protein